MPNTIPVLRTNVQQIENILSGVPSLYGKTIQYNEGTVSAGVATEAVSQPGAAFPVSWVYVPSGLTGTGNVKYYDGVDATGTLLKDIDVVAGDVVPIMTFGEPVLNGSYMEITSDGSTPIKFTHTTSSNSAGVAQDFEVEADTWLDPDAPDTNRNTDSTISLLSFGDEDRGLFKWDLSSFPKTTQVLSCVVEMKVANDAVNAGTIGVYRLLVDWDSAQATYNDRQTGVPWSTPGLAIGVDYALTFLHRFNIPSGSPIRFDITAIMQQWISGTIPNFGFLMKYDLGSTNSLYRVHSKEASAANRPKISIVYSIP